MYLDKGLKQRYEFSFCNSVTAYVDSLSLFYLVINGGIKNEKGFNQLE
jgi:hypothetical protein